MNLSTFEWIVAAAVFGIAITIIGFFLKRIINRADQHEKDISEIKRTYVTKDEMKEIKDELRGENKKLSADISEIKENYLTKDDYYRRQVETDRRLDRIYDLLLELKGDSKNG
jgi:uncharacterized membrane protein YhiD involved in acid resistance